LFLAFDLLKPVSGGVCGGAGDASSVRQAVPVLLVRPLLEPRLRHFAASRLPAI
jgi:hypothetical protein